MTYKEFSSPHSSESPIQDSARVADLLSLPLKPLAPLHLAAQPPRPQTHLKPCRSLFLGLWAERAASAQAAQCRPVDSVVAAVPRDAAICSRPGCGKQRKGPRRSTCLAGVTNCPSLRGTEGLPRVFRAKPGKAPDTPEQVSQSP